MAESRHPGRQRIAGLLRDPELNGALALLLEDLCATLDTSGLANVTDAQLDEIAATEFAVDGAVKQCQVSDIGSHLQVDANGPNVLELQRHLLANEFALVPRP